MGSGGDSGGARDGGEEAVPGEVEGLSVVGVHVGTEEAPYTCG